MTRNPIRFENVVRLTIALCLAFCTTNLWAVQETAPSKENLIKTLEQIQAKLDQQDLAGASESFYLPPDFKPEMLQSSIDNREISAAGIKVLAKQATFGPATEVFKANRAQYFADKFNVDVSQCYGFNFQPNGMTIEVVGVWSGESFKLIALDNVGKLEPPAKPIDWSSLSGDKPNKATLIKTLRYFNQLLQQEKYKQAVQMICAPDDFDANRLAGTRKRREISKLGIDTLEKDGRFGTAIKTFGEERATALCQRANQDVNQCFGFLHSEDGVVGEVIAVWNGKSFRLVRVDDVGKLGATAETLNPASSSPKSETDPKPPLANQADPAPKKTPLTKEQAMERLPALLKAVADAPKDVTAKANLAIAQNAIGNYPAAWQQLVQAHQLQPTHQGVGRGLVQVFNRFRKMSIFRLGVPEDTITSVLGKPTQQVKLASDGKRFVYGFFAVDCVDGKVLRTIDLRGLKEVMFVPDETVVLDLPLQWMPVNRHIDKQISRVTYLPAGEMLKNWTQRFELMRIQGMAKLAIEDLPTVALKQLQTQDPDAKLKVLKQTETEVYFATQVTRKGEKTEHGLVKFLYGKNDVHRVDIQMRTGQPTQETQKKWFALFEKAKLKATKQN